jgi:N-acetylmuramoyl-L-alanine amidase
MSMIILDPGHGGAASVGGSDATGTVGVAHTKEKDLCLAVGEQTKNALSNSGNSIRMTRSSDTNLSLTDRAAVAKNNQAEVFVSIHFNGFSDPNTQGTETFVYQGTPASSSSRQLASKVQEQIVSALGHSDRGVKEENFSVIKPQNHHSNTAACLAEVSFLTDPEEEARLGEEEYRRRIGAAIATGIIEYLGWA